MPNKKIFLYCKKNFYLPSRSVKILIFEENKEYYYYSDQFDNDKNDIYIYYNEPQGYRLYYNFINIQREEDFLVKDFFATKQEQRKLKLLKLKN